MLILLNKGFHEFMLTILPRSLFNILMDLSYSAFVSFLILGFIYSIQGSLAMLMSVFSILGT